MESQRFFSLTSSKLSVIQSISRQLMKYLRSRVCSLCIWKFEHTMISILIRVVPFFSLSFVLRLLCYFFFKCCVMLLWCDNFCICNFITYMNHRIEWRFHPISYSFKFTEIVCVGGEPKNEWNKIKSAGYGIYYSLQPTMQFIFCKLYDDVKVNLLSPRAGTML